MKLSGFYSLLVVVSSVLGVMLSSSSDIYSYTMSLSTEIARQGNSLTAFCNVTSDSSLRFMIIWMKKTVEDNRMVEIGTNNHVNDDFKKSNRYTADYVLEPKENISIVTFRLNISDLQSEDSGLLTCKVGNKEPENFKLFTVLVPVQKIWWTSFDNEVPLSGVPTVIIKEGDNHTFGCHVNGSYPMPEVQVFLGDVDITHLFKLNSVLEKGVGPKGLQPLYYRVDAISKSNIIGYHNMTKPLRCVAKLPNSDLSAETIINVNMTEYSPTFRCKDKMRAKLHDTYFNLTCKVYANPGVTHGKFHWISDENDNNDTLNAGEKNNDMSTDMFQGDAKDEFVMTMTISRVTQQHFDRKYIFEAQSDLKHVNHVIQLERDMSVIDSKPGGCSLHTSKVSLLLMLLLYSFVSSLP